MYEGYMPVQTSDTDKEGEEEAGGERQERIRDGVTKT